MAKVITRYFEDVGTARKIRNELILVWRFSRHIIHFFEDSNDVVEQLSNSGVEPATAKAYKKRLAKGGFVLLVLAGHRPLCVARITREVMAKMGAVDLGKAIEEVEIEDVETKPLSVLSGSPLILSGSHEAKDRGSYMANWPIPLISRRKPFAKSLFPIHSKMANFPIPLISRRKPYNETSFPRHARMADFPIPLLSDRKPSDKFAFPRHARMADFPIPLISLRKPYTGSIFPKHARMANWPFPHLLNGKSDANAIIPGAPKMANFPIPLLSDRKPYDEFAFSKHARMAEFPIPLLSKRKPYTDSAFPRHARMADFILPLVTKRSNTAEQTDKRGFSLSGLLGIPTLTKRRPQT